MNTKFKKISGNFKSLSRFRLLTPFIRLVERSYLLLKLPLVSQANLRNLNMTWGRNSLHFIPIKDVFEISIPQPKGTYCYNPTIIASGERILGFARTTNLSYKPQVDRLGRSVVREKVPYLLNGILSFELDSENHLTNIDELRPLERIPNLEDPKAFFVDGRLKLFCNLVSKEQSESDRSIHCSNVALDLQNQELIIYESPFRKNIEKNWIPFISSGDRLSFFYSTSPQILLICDSDFSSPRARFLDDILTVNFHGGSQVVEIAPNLFMRVARRRVVLPRRRIAILSYLVFHNSQGEIIQISKPFLFKKLGFEICNGLTINGSTLLFSWGEDDVRMFIGKIPVTDLLTWARAKENTLYRPINVAW